jgi:AcrR family transcriptional regulator
MKETKVSQTRKTILDAAVDLFVRDGFEKTPMDAIALAANVAKGTLYYHFSSKEGIIDAILTNYTQAMIARLVTIENNVELSAFQKLSAFNSALHEVNSATFSRLHRMRYIDIHEKTSHLMLTHFAPYLARILEQGARTGEWRVPQPLEYAEILIASASLLFDPHFDQDSIPRRRHGAAVFAAAAMNVPPEAFLQTFELTPSATDSKGSAS